MPLVCRMQPDDRETIFYGHCIHWTVTDFGSNPKSISA